MTLAANFTGVDGGLCAAVGVLLVFSALLALAETGLVRTSRARAQSLAEQRRRGARSLVRLVADPEGFLAPVLLLVLICQLVTATLVAQVTSSLFGAIGIVVGVVLQVVVIFVAAEAIPKQWAVRYSDRAALLAAPVVAAVIAFPPIRIVSRGLIGLSNALMPGGPGEGDPDVTEDELLALADVAVEEDVLEHEERALISSIIEFGDTIVREVMVPRPDIVAVESTATVDDALERAMATGLSRLLVFDRSLDDVVAVAYTRDLIRATRANRGAAPVREAARAAHYVPETKRVAPLLREMQENQFHIAVVVDEYGGTAGVVTLEDLIEELVGEIADEFESSEPRLVPTGPDAFLVAARMPVDEVNELLDLELPVGDWDTIGGLLLHLAGHVPRPGESVATPGAVLVAERVQARRVATVRVERTPETGHDDDEDES